MIEVRPDFPALMLGGCIFVDVLRIAQQGMSWHDCLTSAAMLIAVVVLLLTGRSHV